uniref:tRNA-dihydrouridine(47) synthase [NAD(P)(+)] n=1 Tax=Angiostrongylus cantonensis TaxID=6313 RepID=A0A0K0CZN4_ANGCA
MCDSVEKDMRPSSSVASKNVVGQNTRRKERKTPGAQRDVESRLHVTDSHMRLNFLHQAAIHLSYQSNRFSFVYFVVLMTSAGILGCGLDDGYAKLARRYAKLFRDVLKTERVKVVPDIVQTFCRKCKQMFVAKVKRCELTLVQFKVIQSKCILCGYKRNYEWKTDYLSRNQKHWIGLDDDQNSEKWALVRESALNGLQMPREAFENGRNTLEDVVDTYSTAGVAPIKKEFLVEKCSLEHDLITFLANKPPDIGDSCPVFEARGTCPFSYTCRFGEAHTDFQGSQMSKTPVNPYQEVSNGSSVHIQIALRKRTFDFSRSQKVLEALKEGCLGAMEREKPILNMKTLKGKKYLAPLTTVGNLPFRRLCVQLGADVTCSEMALSTNLLSGAPSEYSLLRRHPCEKIFGVQLAGGFPDTMTKSAQIVVDEMNVDFIDVNMGCPIDVVNEKGGGCALPNRPNKMIEVLSALSLVIGKIPLTVKLRSGLKGVLTADETIRTMMAGAKPDLITLHPRSKEQRYTKLANWNFVNPCLEACTDVPLWICGDVLSWEDYYTRLEEYSLGGIMIGRGALIKPWIFTEIDERRTWDISANERLDLLKRQLLSFVNYGLDYWGSDDIGVDRTRRFLLEWLSFQCRYIPVGLLERLPQRMNERPPLYRGRSDLETLLSSNRAADWIEISPMDWSSVNGAEAKVPMLDRIIPLTVQAQVNGDDVGGYRQQHGQGGEGGGPANAAVEDDLHAAPGIEVRGEIRVLAQTVVISDVSFTTESFNVHTEITALPLATDLKTIHLHLGLSTFLPNEVAHSGKVTINGMECQYSRMVQPTGVKFVYNLAPDGTIEKGAHLFTYRSSLLASTREWLPCVDASDQLSLWRIHITCDTWLTAVASGDLVSFDNDADKHLRTWNYQQLIPTAACNIGFVIGHFSTYALPDMAEVTNFAPVGLLSLLKHTVAPLDKILEYFEELLSCRFPYSTYKQVFVDMECRQLLALGVAQQFFGCFISPAHFLDWWLVRSLSSEYLFQIKKLLNTVCNYESQWGKVILRPHSDAPARLNLHCEPRCEHTCSPLYAENMVKKGHLAMRMLSKRLGHEPYFQVLHKILSVGQQMAERRDRPASWTHLVVTTETFFRTVTNVTGQEIPTFMEQWIYNGGHASFRVQYVFNRKRNMIELEVKQKVEPGNGRLRYVGPLTVVVQELDGSFSHTVQIDGDISRADLQCHSKGRRQKKKRVPLYSGDEVEVDLSNMDPDSPVLWIRLDPELHLIRNMIINQPDYQWEYMLRYERNVLAQLQALERLQLCPNPQSRDVLLETISNEVFFYRKIYGAKSCPSLPKSNNFVVTSQNLQQYFIQQVSTKVFFQYFYNDVDQIGNGVWETANYKG